MREAAGADRRDRRCVAEPQVAEPVRSSVCASEKVPVAVNCWSAPTAIDGFAGVTAMLVERDGAVVVADRHPAAHPRDHSVARAPLSWKRNVSAPLDDRAVDDLHTHDLARLAGGEDELAGGDDVVAVAEVAAAAVSLTVV